MHDADTLLVSFLRSTEKSEQDRLLDELISVHAAPIIRYTVRQRLGLHIDLSGVGSRHPDADDIYGEILNNILQRLRKLQLQEEQNRIDNFRQYVFRVAENICHNYLRDKYPARLHLKDRIRNLLSRNPTFKTWKSGGGTILCGLAIWKDRKHTSYRTEQIDETVERIRATIEQNGYFHSVPLAEIITETLKLSSQPIKLDDLVTIVAELQDVVDTPIGSLDQPDLFVERLTYPIVQVDTLLELRGTLQEYWRQVLQLPMKKRTVLCLSFSDETGEDLLSQLLHTGIVTFTQFAEALGLAEDELLDIWSEMPLSDAVIAIRLGVSSGMVRKLRYLAKKEIRARLVDAPARK